MESSLSRYIQSHIYMRNVPSNYLQFVQYVVRYFVTCTAVESVM